VQDIAKRFIMLTKYNSKLTLIDLILQLQAFRFKIWFTINAEGVIN
jgi:hypothetical protein